ncbi:hypothetical protein LGM71_06605 [Burkholderia sp. AU33545]|nr:hypothetical protein [Burkholderia sp. AU33545]MCA8200713.1 hypothetical protein [Burkholderia sp. AU33545]
MKKNIRGTNLVAVSLMLATAGVSAQSIPSGAVPTSNDQRAREQEPRA